ncbi:MAG: PIN domain-containing protein [Candidatus Aminicenantes bacterium]|nr:PIN domain-containing protein [Candidatus Aminicenantes bacterium]
MKIYLDNCCFNRPFDDQSQIKIRLESEAKLYIQAAIYSNEIELAWSYILDYENYCNPFEERKNSIKKWRDLATTDIEESGWIIQQAQVIMNLGVKSKDALHVACAIASKCDYFLTTDERLIKKLKNFQEIVVINPLQFISLKEE